MQAQNGLILTRKIMAACQIRSIIEIEATKADIALSNIEVYAAMSRHACQFLICDIEDIELQGMFVADWFRCQSRGAPWYAMCHYGNTHKMRLAREKGAHGYFFLNNSGLALDARSGMAYALLSRNQKTLHTSRHPIPQLHQVQAQLHQVQAIS